MSSAAVAATVSAAAPGAPITSSPAPSASTPAQLRELASRQQREGDAAGLRRSLEQLLARERTPRALNDLGLILSDQAEFQAATALLTEAVAGASPDQRGLYQANLALTLRRQWRDAEAEAVLNQALAGIEAYRGPLAGWRASNLQRSRAVALLQRSRIEERRGRFDQALHDARAAQAAATEAVARLPEAATPAERLWALADLANTQRREFHVHLQAQQTRLAEEALARWQASAERHALGPVVQAQLSAAAAQLALVRQRFDEAGQRAAEADARYAAAGFVPQHLARVATLETRLAALWAQQRAAEALPLLQALDAAVQRPDAGASAPDAEALRLPLLRGLVWLDAGQPAAAAELFDAQARRIEATAGTGSLWWAEARGLQGLALLAAAGGDAAKAAPAAPWLARSVAALTDPANAAVPDGSGLRSLIRRRVVQAHVAVQLGAGSAPDVQTAALLDWVADGAVQRALTQAATRLAVADAGLRRLVRREQNLRHELESLARGTGAATWGLSGDDDTAMATRLPADAPERLRAAHARWAEAARELRQRHPAFANLVQPTPPTLDLVARAIAADEALLVLASREQDTLLWLLRADGAHTSLRVELPLARTEALVAALRRSLELPDGGRLPAFDRAAAGELHRLLIAPLQARLQDVRHLAVVTSGPLAALPLAVLAPADGRPTREADWLIRRTAISQTTSLAAWLAARRSVSAAREPGFTLMAWGDPLFGGTPPATAGAPASSAGGPPARRTLELALRAAPRGQREAPDPRTAFPSLPDTRDELLAMARALGADPARSLHLGRQATRESVLEASRSGRLARASVVAFATHGLKAGEWPGLEQPALVMAIPEQGAAPGVAPDATAHMLSLDDALALELDADWVVLSACNTTAGDREAGEALSGLARGMFYAGARSLLATHWAVESRSAALLVSETFRAFASAARPGKAEALRQGMLTVMARPGYAHPFYWAPYGVIGDGGR